MNKAILVGRLTRDPNMTYTQGDNPRAVARYTLAVDRRFKNAQGEYETDFISCVSFGKTAEFVEKYFNKGKKMGAVGSIQTGKYTNKEGQTVYTTDVVVDEVEFVESKAASENNTGNTGQQNYNQGGQQGYNQGGQQSYYQGGQQNYNANYGNYTQPQPANVGDGFVNIPDGIDEGLPFN